MDTSKLLAGALQLRSFGVASNHPTLYRPLLQTQRVGEEANQQGKGRDDDKIKNTQNEPSLKVTEPTAEGLPCFPSSFQYSDLRHFEKL